MRVIIGYCQFPETDKNSGALRVYEIVKMLAGAGHSITFLAASSNDAKYSQALERLGVECICDQDRAFSGSANAFGAFLKERNFDVAIFVQHFVYNRYAPYLRMALPQCRLVFDTLDLEFVRCEREAQIVGTSAARENARDIKVEEHSAIRDAESVWVVTEDEKHTVLQIAPEKDVRTIPNIHAVDPDLPGFGSRSGVVFLGSYRHRPNVDAIHYFMQKIFPQIEVQLPGVPFSIAGAYPTDDLYRYEQESPNVHVTGFVADHRALLKSHRVGVVPLRYGAGLKGKIGEYFGCGLPCVTTSIGAEGMNMVSGKNALVADDPSAFAREVARLYTDPELWQSLSSAGVDYIEASLSVEAIRPGLLEAVSAAAHIPIVVSNAPLSAQLWMLRNPRKLRLWLSTARRTLMRGGIREVCKQFRIWLHRPSGGTGQG